MADFSSLLPQAPAPVQLMNPFDIAMKRAQLAEAQNTLAGQQIQNQSNALGLQRAQADYQAQQDYFNYMRNLQSAPAQGGQTQAAPAQPQAPAPVGAINDGQYQYDADTGVNVPVSAPTPVNALAGDTTATAPKKAAPVTAAPGGGYKAPSVDDMIAAGVRPDLAMSFGSSMLDIQKKSSDVAKARTEINSAVDDAAGMLAREVIKANFDPTVTQVAIQHFAAQGPEYAAKAQQIVTAIRQNPNSAQALIQGLANASQKQVETTAKETEASAKGLEAQVAQKRQAMEQDNNDFQRASSALGSAQNSAQYAKAYFQLSADQQKKFVPPEAWTPQTAAQVRQNAMTSEQQQLAIQKDKELAQQAWYQHQTVATQQGELALKQRAEDFAEGNVPYSGTMLAAMQRGEAPLPPARSKMYAPVLSAIKQADPTFTADRFDNRKAWEQSAASGEVGKKLASLNQAAEHLNDFFTASKNEGFVGPLIPSKTKSQLASATQVVSNEVPTLLASGNQPVKEELEKTADNLGSRFPAVRDAAAKQYVSAITARYGAEFQRYSETHGEPFPVDRFINPQAVTFMKGQGVNLYDLANKSTGASSDYRQTTQPQNSGQSVVVPPALQQQGVTSITRVK